MYTHLITTRILPGASEVPVLPIFTRIINEVKSLIETYMTQANGFSQDYGSINEDDYTARTYPAINFEYPEELELPDDMINRDSVRTEVHIRVMLESEADIEVASQRVVSDFNLFFQSFRGTLKNKGLILYDYLGCEYEDKLITAYPRDVILKYSFKYRRIIGDPYTVDSTSTDDVYSGSAWTPQTPVFSAIVAQIESNISNMTIDNGYNFDYGSVDDWNYTTRTYPAVFLDYPEEIGLDESNGIAAHYPCETPITFVVRTDTSSDLDKTMYLVRSDFNNMFSEYLTTLQSAGMKEYEYVDSEINYTLVKAYPTEIKIQYILTYRRQKNNPYLT